MLEEGTKLGDNGCDKDNFNLNYNVFEYLYKCTVWIMQINFEMLKSNGKYCLDEQWHPCSFMCTAII